ncbi:MAG: cell surface protein SprA [Saprospiraceae bacterium]|nr:cell surface protein SprA [Saprospiraceae bacterium]MCB9324657.1 cell surface protein SprA [Lewinellaceae bacterium]
MRRVFLPFSLFCVIIAGAISAIGNKPDMEDPYEVDYVKASPQDTIPPPAPRYEDFINGAGNNPFDLQDPAAVEQQIEYDPATGNYIITETIGNDYFRPPTYMTFDEYMEYRRKKEEDNYFKQLMGVSVDGDDSVRDPIEKLDIEYNPLDKLFGGTTVDIRPQGSIDLKFGVDYQFTDNPILTNRQAKNANFDFDMDIKMNVTGKIGEKLSLTTNYNSAATFNFDNQIKLDYNSDLFGEDDIIKRIEAGNVGLPLRGTLIQGAQSLFGIKTELQFGHLRLTAIASQQQSKNETIRLEGGSQLQEFEAPVDQYDENRHFFLSHYSRDHYEEALARMPYINSLMQIKNLEVWITNDRREVENVRDIVALADLGESEAANLVNPGAVNILPGFPDIEGKPLPENEANDLYSKLRQTPNIKQIDKTVTVLTTQFNLEQGRDFEKVSARKLSPTEYTFNPLLGFISLNINVQPDQVLGVHYTYDYNGKVYAVGEQSTSNSDVSSDTTDLTPEVLFVKMLKSTTQQTDIPTWDLMMKNVYSIGAYQVENEDFKLDIYYDDPGKGLKRFLPTSALAGKPLLEVFNMDRLNSQNDPQPDGRFDFVPGTTINPSNGRIYFPVLEPFGDALEAQFGTDQEAIDKYVYQDLYTQTSFQAIENAEKNRFVIKGSYKSSVSSEISLGAFNIPEGSVRVSAGGTQLIEYKDYEVDYSTGRLKILNDAILASGAPINISFEDNTLFGFQQKTMLGLRADYEVSKNLNIGATALKLFERPFTPKVNIGEDPVNNSIFGLDVNFSKEVPWITKMVNGIPLISTKAPSSINVSAEAAYLKPGHARAINQSKEDKSGVVYLDDFEGSASSLDMRTPANKWFLSSVPHNDNANNNPLFPESQADSIFSGVNRARLNWYRLFTDSGGGQQGETAPYTSIVPQDEVFPNKQITPNQLNTVRTLNLAFNPRARGPYNFDPPSGTPWSAGMVPEGDTIRLLDPETRWGGMMRELQTSDFQTANIEFLEFWMLSPFLDDNDAREPASNANNRQGTLYINLGNISEDVLQDSRKFFENGLPRDANDLNRRIDDTPWGVVPVNNPVAPAFDNTSEEARTNQDVGLDGLDRAGEVAKFSGYLDGIRAVNSNVADAIEMDPSNDDFKYYTDPSFGDNVSVTDRYKFFNNPEGNSKANRDNATRQSSTNSPDAEDINGDNSLNESESYYQYEIPIRFDATNPREIEISDTSFVTDRLEAPNGRIWYRFRIPLRTEQKKAIGGITGFRSIRFMRMYMHGFNDPVVLRFASLDLVRNQWRRYTKTDSLSHIGTPDCGPIVLDVDAVNIEENSSRTPFAYTLPLGIQREQSVGVFSTLQNEQSLVLHVENLCDGAAQGVFKVIEQDLRVYEKLKMFVHAEELEEMPEVPNEALSIFIRMGSDIQNNYYEYEIPLVMSDPTAGAITGGIPTSSPYKAEVWRSENEFDFALKLLKDLKKDRNANQISLTNEYRLKVPGTNNHYYAVKGNPNLGRVKMAMIGIRNTYDDGMGDPYSAEVWVNELRLTGLDERGGFAGLARMDVQLADLGNLSVAGNFNSVGFGALDDQVAERSRERITGYDMSVNLNVDKFLPQDWGIRLPFYGQISNVTSTPEYDPYDLDIPLKENLDLTSNQDSIKALAQDVTSIKAFNFTNVRKERTGGGDSKPKPWDVENFSASYAYTDTKKRDPLVEFEHEKLYKASLDYGYSHSPKYIEPFKGIKNKNLKLISEINLNPIPNSFTFSNYFDRKFNTIRYRFTGLDDVYNTYYAKYFKWERDYALNWNFTKALKFNFDALASATIDEPDERQMLLNPGIENVNRYRRDSIVTNIKDLGRPKNYTHNISLNYTLPIRYLPFMDWTTVRAQYKSSYTWTAGSVVENYLGLGNIIQNSQDRQINADLNFVKLYDSFDYLKGINRPARSTSKTSKSRDDDKKDKETPSKDEKNKKKKSAGPSQIERVLIRPLLLVRRAKFDYSERFQTVIPGFIPISGILGMSSGFGDPGLAFVAGAQPKIRTLNEADRYGSQDWLFNNRGFVTDSVRLNQKVIQRYTQGYDGRLSLEPLPDFKIDIDISRSYTQDFEERFKRVDYASADKSHTGVSLGGSMTVSYSALQTLFTDSTGTENLFRTFKRNQVALSQRLGTGVHEDPSLAESGYADGYGQNQQDILIPAFIAAYTQQDPLTMDLNIFNILPKVNWKIDYNGLSKIPALKDIFSKFSFSHGYKSTLTINRYVTNDLYDRYYDAGTGQSRDAFSEGGTGNFYSRLEIPQIEIQEAFSPLIGIDMTLQNGLTFKLDYNKMRSLSLSAVNNLLSERQSKEISIASGYRIRDVDIPFLTGSNKKKKGKSSKDDPKEEDAKGAAGGRGGKRGGGSSSLDVRDLDFQFDFSLRDDVTYARKLDLSTSDPTRGSYALSFSPSVEYKLNKRLSLRLFFDYRKNIPKTSAGYKRIDSSGGVVVRFEL